MSGVQLDILQRDLQNLASLKTKLEEENAQLRAQTVELEDSNNTLRSQLVAARKEFSEAGPSLLASQRSEQQRQQVCCVSVSVSLTVSVYCVSVCVVNRRSGNVFAQR